MLSATEADPLEVERMARAVRRAHRGVSVVDRILSRRNIATLCRERPGTSRSTLVELALMRAGYRGISYSRAVRELVDALETGGI